jgi:hypothetical protein
MEGEEPSVYFLLLLSSPKADECKFRRVDESIARGFGREEGGELS